MMSTSVLEAVTWPHSATQGAVLNLGFDIDLNIPDGALGAGEAMRRREFITLLRGPAVPWLLGVPA